MKTRIPLIAVKNEIPEPAMALLVGHEIAYYGSLR